MLIEKKEYRLLLVTLLTGLLVYAQLFFFSYISWDDPEMVFKNDAVRTFDIKAFFTQQYVGNYIPLTMLTHGISWFIFDDSPGGHHALNILLHLLNGFMVYQLGRRLFQSQIIVLSGTAIFLLHPVQVESVAWISELKNILSTTFYLLAAIEYLKYTARAATRNYWGSFTFFIAACLSKPSAVVFPLAAIAFAIIAARSVNRRMILTAIPFFIVSIAAGLINLYTQSKGQFINHAHEFPFHERLGFAGFALLKYLLQYLWPARLSVIYPYPERSLATFVTGYIFLGIIITAILLLLKKGKRSAVMLIFFIIVNFVLVLQFIPFGEALYADRYMYVPLIGFAWLTGLLLRVLSLPSVVAAGSLIIVLGAATFFRTHVWKSAISLYEDILKKHPDMFIALNSAGVESMFLNRDSDALQYLNKAVQVAPRNYKGFYNRGLLMLKNRQPREAIKSFNQALALYDYGKAYAARASAYYMLGDLAKAINDAEIAIRTEPQNSKAFFVLGNCYNDLNELDKAIEAYNKSIEMNGREADFYFKRAIAYGKKQEFKASQNDLTLCISLRPDHWEAYYWRAVASRNLGTDACSDLMVAARNNFEPAVNAFQKYCR